jgi:hypothetical protein
MLAPSAERLLPATLMGLLIGLLIVGATGCYSRVVKESGIGRGASKVYEPNLELPEDSDPWNLSAAGSSPGVKNWKAAGQKSQSSGTSSGKSSAD